MTDQPTLQFALPVLIEATKFLFDEAGKLLDHWREHKGEGSKPRDIKVSEQADAPVVWLDDVELAINADKLLLMQDSLETSLNIIRKKTRMLNAYRRQLADPIISPADKARLEATIPDLEREIEVESGRLKKLLDGLYVSAQ